MYTLDFKKYIEISRNACADSCVLVKNNNVLPIKDDQTISIFGRTQIDTYISGTGSGGMVNVPYKINILEGLRAKRKINENLVSIYENFIEKNPFDKGQGWAQEPWSQVELELTNDIVKDAAEKSDIAIMVIGRSAGEDKDTGAVEGSYYLSEIENKNMDLICTYFEKVVVLLNVGNIIDMSFYQKPSAILYTWHGGVESGNGYADVLCGDVNPSGGLPDTASFDLDDNITTENFGDLNQNYYKEDIFVGYRYFETFAKDKVLYPFGYGLSYTNFEITNTSGSKTENGFNFKIDVKNIGSVKGKKSVQVYAKAPSGKLGKASRVLVGFAKTKELSENEICTLEIDINEYDFSSYDEKNSQFILEKGKYEFYAGFDVRRAENIFEYNYENNQIILKCTQSLAPVEDFERIHEVNDKITYENVPKRLYDINQRIATEKKLLLQKTDFGYNFTDVKKGKITLDEFVQELSDLELIHLSRGEGMCSPKVTSGTAGCFGGVTQELVDKGIPIACCSDGPCGIRMDSGTMAFSVPNGTAFASTFDTKLVTKVFEFIGLELRSHKIDTLLGPGINIHRSPLCGRNFEYFSEDPFLTGKMAVAQLDGMHKSGVTGTIKHFAVNNQENNRNNVNSIVSERALREIYLKAFEMAVKEGNAHSIMTAYNPINGIQSASNFDLNTQILKNEWSYDGLIMTDWWAKMNVEGKEKPSTFQTAAMISAGNQVYMVNSNAKENSNKDDSETKLKSGELKRYELLRNAKGILNAILQMNCSKDNLKPVTVLNKPKDSSKTINQLGTTEIIGNTKLNLDLDTTKKTLNKFIAKIDDKGIYNLEFDLECNASDLAQVSMSVIANGIHAQTITLKGNTKQISKVEFAVFTNINTYIDLYFSESGMVVNSIYIKKIKDFD